jgi:hypothetical protein
MPTPAQQLQSIQSFADLVRYLEGELDWPLHEYGFDELTFEYLPGELGLKEADAAKVKSIHQLRPLQHGQPWGIFFVEFERKKLPVVVLRRILSHLVVKKRAAANRADAAAWNAEDLLFIAAYGDDGPARAAAAPREIAFAHFHQEAGDLPTLRVLGWDGADTPLKLEYVAGLLHERLQWPADPQDHAAWRTEWASAFRHRPGHVIMTADALAEALARLARQIRLAALTLLDHETEQGALRGLHKAFQTALIHDLSEADFADTYAQTITYGLLTAAISRTDRAGGRGDTTLYTHMLADVVPITNPFLREMLQTFLQAGGQQRGINFDELGIQDVVELLRGEDTDLPAILRDFGNKTQGEDPVIHFYEHFLTAYDKALKVKRGVFYTPQPVVSYIVRSVDELLRSEFGLEDGLASTVTWGELAQRIPGLAIPKDTAADSPFVVVLDPATGTATFLVEVIDVIHRTLDAKWQRQGLSAAQRQAAWNEYVPQHLLPRLYGYELMMAPYAIAHMKIGLKLHETGYRFGSEERVRVYLTNALAPADDVQQALDGILPALAHEAQAVNLVKRNVRFTVVVGNPPYSNFGQLNRNSWILGLLEDYKHGLDERKINLDDDFIKFVRFSQELLEATTTGVLGLITNNVYEDGITHRQMRRALTGSFRQIHIFDLHGSSKRLEKAPDGSKDENVFDITVGVSVLLGSKLNQRGSFECRVYHADLWGKRSAKNAILSETLVNSTKWQLLNPTPPYLFFVPRSYSLNDEYSSFWSVQSVFTAISSGIQTKRDSVAVAETIEELTATLHNFADLPSETLRLFYNLPADGRDWRINWASEHAGSTTKQRGLRNESVSERW